MKDNQRGGEERERECSKILTIVELIWVKGLWGSLYYLHDFSENLKLFQNKKLKFSYWRNNNVNTSEMPQLLKFWSTLRCRNRYSTNVFIKLCNFIGLKLPMCSTIHFKYDSFVQQLNWWSKIPPQAKILFCCKGWF